MHESSQIRETMLRFYDRRAAADEAAYDDLVSRDFVLSVGTAPDERFSDREVVRGHFSTPGVAFEPGSIVAYENGDLGWAFDEPTATFGSITARVRVTAVLHREDGSWRIVHLHFSAAIPDEQLAVLATA